MKTPAFIDREQKPNPLAESLYAAIGGDDDTEGVALREYRFGTIRGLWRETPTNMDIVAVINDEPGNGQFRQLVAYFKRRSTKAGKGLRFVEVFSEDLANHLVSRLEAMRQEHGTYRSNTMLIALDFDGTFDRDPDFWRDFVHVAENMHGHTVLIVSCRHDDDERENLDAMMEMTSLPKWRHKLTSGEAKKHWMERNGWHVDVWIDDEPENILNGK